MRRALSLSLLLLACHAASSGSSGPGPIPMTTPTAPPSAPPATASSTATPTPPAPPSTGPGSLDIVLAFPAVSEKPPTLAITVHNRGRAPLHVQVFPNAACQVASFFALRVQDAAGKDLPLARCIPSAGTDRIVAVGGKLELAVPFAELVPGVKSGSYELSCSPVLPPPNGSSADAEAGPQRTFSQPGYRLTIRPVVSTLFIKRGETVELAGGAKLTFFGNSHKDVDEASAPGPLIIEGTLTALGGKPERFYAHAYPDTSRIFNVGEHYFELGDYVYGVSMKVKYFGQLR